MIRNYVNYLIDKYIRGKIINYNDNLLVEKLKKKFRHINRETYYKGISYGIDSLYCHAVPGTLETIVMYLDNFKASHKKNKLANIGGGTGQVSDLYKSLGFDVFNLDISVTKRDDHNICYDLNSFSDIPLEKESFEIVIAQEIIEHIENPWRLIRDCYNLLKKGGVLILSTPNVNSKMSKKIFFKTGFFHWFNSNNFDFHINPLFYWEIELILRQTGFKLKKIMGSGEYYFHKSHGKDEIIANNEGLIFIAIKV